MKPIPRLSAIASVAVLFFSAARVVNSDAVSPSAPWEHWEQTFGDVQFVVGRSPPQPHGSLEWPELYVAGKLVATYPGFFAQAVYASPDNMYFVAVSNQGTSRYAIAVLDRTGAVLISRPHNNGDLHYCEMSVTNNRHWIDLKAPNVRFRVDGRASASGPNKYLRSVTVQGCDGRDIVLQAR